METALFMQAKLLIKDLLFLSIDLFKICLVVRILLSWFPDFHSSRAFKILCNVTDPYLEPFRRLIPPLGGFVDISPIVAFYTLYIIERLIVSWI